ncbi:MAG: ParA family protein [Parcubacteria group bacterium]|nr:ParA family protein [Parcubacteria group bacterium]
MPRVILVANQKGGTGKSTTATNLVPYLAAHGKRVLLIDLDPQANATAGMGIASESVEKGVYHFLMGLAHPAETIRRTPLMGVDIIPASADLAGAAVELVTVEGREYQLKEMIKKIPATYDYIFIDTPPSLGLLTVNGMVAAHAVLIPVQCEYYALEGLNQLLHTIELVKTNLEVPLTIMGALLTMYDRRQRLDREVAKEVRRNFPGHVFEAVIPRNVHLAEAPSVGKTIFQYSPDSPGAQAYRQLAEEIIRLNNTHEENV